MKQVEQPSHTLRKNVKFQLDWKNAYIGACGWTNSCTDAQAMLSPDVKHRGNLVHSVKFCAPFFTLLEKKKRENITFILGRSWKSIWNELSWIWKEKMKFNWRMWKVIEKRGSWNWRRCQSIRNACKQCKMHPHRIWKTKQLLITQI